MFLVIFIKFKRLKVGKYIEYIKYIRQNLSENMLIVKPRLEMKCLHIFFSFLKVHV